MSVLNWKQFCFVAVLSGVAFDFFYFRTQRKRRALPLPPGPPPLPIAGNIQGINASSPWLTYTEWANQYGDLVYSRFFNQEIIVINSVKVARVLLEQRSNIYSDRPEIPTNALFGVDFSTVMMRYGDRWRQHRRLLHQAFRVDAAPAYRPMQQRKTHQLLLAIFENPDKCFEHLHTFATSIIMSAVYDYETKAQNDAMVTTVDRAMKLAIEEVRPEVAAFFVVFPFLLSLSSWAPGVDIHKKAAQSRVWCKECVDAPFEDVLKRMKEGTAGRSMVSSALNRMKANGSDEGQILQAVKDASATAFGAASETTAATLQVFILAMILFPEVQKKAQSVIDATVESSRLPLWTDRPSLKYIDAILRETLRWHPILPLSIPHATMDSDIYDGCYIPKGHPFLRGAFNLPDVHTGATVMPNIWAMTRDETKYRNPSEFNPERFLDAGGNLNDDTLGYAFGFGRRICAGRHLASASLWYAMSGMLALFEFSRANDSDGNEIHFEPQWSTGLAIRLLPFPFKLTPRKPDMSVEDLYSLISLSSS